MGWSWPDASEVKKEKSKLHTLQHEQIADLLWGPDLSHAIREHHAPLHQTKTVERKTSSATCNCITAGVNIFSGCSYETPAQPNNDLYTTNKE